MVALSTGWTPDVMADMPARFLAACRWALFARSLAGQGLPSGDVPLHASPEAKAAALAVRADVTALRAVLYPEG